MKKYIENCSTIGLIVLITGQTLRITTHWAYADWLEWAGMGLLLITIVYRLVHFKEYKGLNILTLVLFGLMLLLVISLLITQ